MTSTTLPAPSASIRRALLAGLIAAVVTAVVNGGIALAAVALGVPRTGPLTPAADVLFSVVASVVGAIGWRIVVRRASDPRRVLTRLVPTVLAVSFVPDVLLGVATAGDTGVAPVLALALMHVTTVALAVPVYARMLPAGPPSPGTVAPAGA